MKKVTLLGIIMGLIFGVLLGAVKAASPEPKLPPGRTCAEVIAYVATYGRVLAYATARLEGYSKRDIKEAEKCLPPKK